MLRIFASLLLVISVSFPASANTLFKEYEPGLIEAELKNGRTVFVDFYATWCSTCRTQERVIHQIVEDNPQFADAMTFIKVNWDEYKNSDLISKYGIPRRSTLILVKGDELLGKLVAQTSSSAIQELIEKGL